MESLYLNHSEFIGVCKSVSGGANQKFFSPLSALRRGGVWGEPHKKMKGKFLGLPRERSERPEARQVFRSKWVRAKVSNSPPSRHARAEKESSRPRRPARQSRTPQKSFVFLLEEKMGRAQKKSRENFFAGWRALASGGGAASSLGVLRKMGSDFFKQTPHPIVLELCPGLAIELSMLLRLFLYPVLFFSQRLAILRCIIGMNHDGCRKDTTTPPQEGHFNF